MNTAQLLLLSFMRVLALKIRKKEVAKAWHIKNREKTHASQRIWRLENRGQRIAGMKAWRNKNSEHVKAYRKKYREDHRERLAEYGRQCFQNNPAIKLSYNQNRRARKRGNGGEHTSEQWLALKTLYGNKCLCCGRTEVELLAAGLKISRDHILPIKLGGTNNIENIQPLCLGRGGCNNHKHVKHINYRSKFLLTRTEDSDNLIIGRTL